jgi:DNA mismatch endonuclease, patch repair protein
MSRSVPVSMGPTSERMRRIRRRDTGAELAVRSVAHRIGLRFRVCDSKLPGSPDVVFPKHKLCLFVHGCFWHRHENCGRASMPKSNRVFWEDKFAKNVERDRNKVTALRALDWRVVTVWECETADADTLERRLREIFAEGCAASSADTYANLSLALPVR